MPSRPCQNEWRKWDYLGVSEGMLSRGRDGPPYFVNVSGMAGSDLVVLSCPLIHLVLTVS